MVSCEPDTCEISVVAPAVTAVLGKQEGMVDAVAMPERDAVLVVLNDLAEDRGPLYVFSVIRVQPDEEKHCRGRLDSLKRPMGEQRTEFAAGVR
jgi:hypothetical protein